MIRNRRHYARYIPNSRIFAYLRTRRGLLYNLGEGGMAADVDLTDDTEIIPVGLGLAYTSQRIEASGRIVWKDNSKNRVGLQFADLPETSRQQIRQLLSAGAIEDDQQGNIATQPSVAEPKPKESLFTLSSLAASDGTFPPPDNLPSSQGDYEQLASLRSAILRAGKPSEPPPSAQMAPGHAVWTRQRLRRLIVAGMRVSLVSLILVAVVALLRIQGKTRSETANFTRTTFGSLSAPTIAPAGSSAPPVASAPSDATLIAQVEVSRSGRQTNVLVEGNGRLSYQASRLNNPERLVLDFSGVHLALARTSLPGDGQPVRGVRLGQFKPDVARVVIDLEHGYPYKVKAEDKSVTVVFAPSVIGSSSQLEPVPALRVGQEPKRLGRRQRENAARAAPAS